MLRLILLSKPASGLESEPFGKIKLRRNKQSKGIISGFRPNLTSVCTLDRRGFIKTLIFGKLYFYEKFVVLKNFVKT
ncbi:MAG: hypothetical protein EVJ48_07150 [Candidatus Acidulodesulfobacterium acidiphilum]|uniref:Uncharacterized protein n=1 Tax=Candidatus Acidulodesulfobacterium acidiphilum TaxID=2597224 RepID=A0A520XAU1_9DELT|nr:MAG: hypothetical protein EVJ48_07150 [Candidatus Acidulodesulfobacterium acidiphilum]